ncbi:class I SAM-dependent methyltransferase [Flavilitoribacter nigricans]|nr:class I SAM-dependent methyltransferase [Flavilitoribacter nigricans]
MDLYDQQHIRDFYNRYGEQETRRWEKSIVEKVKLHVHRHYLDRHIRSEDRVLELGAGTGIFTRLLAERVKALTVTDLSPVQLDLNRRETEEAGLGASVDSWAVRDICDLRAYPDASFDRVVCYGGPLSYVFDQKQRALSEMRRVLRPGGKALLSVMNLWGTIRESLEKIILPISPEDNEKILASGNLHPTAFAPSDHHCHMFRLAEFRADLETAGFTILELSASNCLSTLRAQELEALQKDTERWAYFLDLEIRACASPGILESGTHLIAVVRV